jgi:hypothetical protein
MSTYTIARSRENTRDKDISKGSWKDDEEGRIPASKNPRNKRTTDKIINPTNIFMPMGVLNLMIIDVLIKKFTLIPKKNENR